ncbi:MAG: hypothetical protein R2759_06300 [Bacteroidales bacterium]
MIEKIRNIKISSKSVLLSALKQMDAANKKLLLVFDEEKFINILSIGDIQRAIIKNCPLETPINNILRNNTRIALETDSFDSIKQTMEEFRIECMPVIDIHNKLVDVYFWEDVFGKDKGINTNKL